MSNKNKMYIVTVLWRLILEQESVVSEAGGTSPWSPGHLAQLHFIQIFILRDHKTEASGKNKWTAQKYFR